MMTVSCPWVASSLTLGEAPRNPPTTIMESFALPDGRKMAYTVSPAGLSSDHRTVLLSNSLAEDLTSWDRVAAVLESKGMRVIRYDLPGHGRSEPPSDAKLSLMSFETLSDDVASLLKHLGVTKLHAWIGVSMGAIKAIYFTVRHPGIVSKLVVADAIASSPVVAGICDNFAARVDAAKAANSMSQDLDDTRKRWFGDAWMADHPEETERMKKSMATTTIRGLETCCAALRRPSFNLQPLYADVGRGCDEALVLVGERDGNLPVQMRSMRQSLEDSLRHHGKKTAVNMEIIKGAGHVPYVDGYEDFCDIVTKFLV